MNPSYQEFLNQIHADILSAADIWEARYGGFAQAIAGSSEKLHIHVAKPLFQYTTLSNEVGRGLKSILRFCGQEVATVRKKDGCYQLVISPANAENNQKYFRASSIPAIPGCYDWHSPQAEEFRRFFRDCPVRTAKSPEHTLESLVLTELEKTSRKDKSLTGITPVKIAGRRFQMPTPIRGSDHHHIRIAPNGAGGGIDILARQRRGNRSFLNVIELKDELTSQEPPELVIRQAIAYGVFLRDLIRSDTAKGRLWCEIFGISYPEGPLSIRCTAAMPEISDLSLFDRVGQLRFPDSTGDCLTLHLMRVRVDDGQIETVDRGFSHQNLEISCENS